MTRKKKSEMTYIERIDRELKGATWDEAEEVGIEILARVMALHAYSRKYGEEHLSKMLQRICNRADEWAQENSFILAMASVENDRLKNEDEQ